MYELTRAVNSALYVYTAALTRNGRGVAKPWNNGKAGISLLSTIAVSTKVSTKVEHYK